MKWYAKTYSQPQIGDRRVVKRFLLFPKCLGGIYRWLEIAELVEEFMNVSKGIDYEFGIETYANKWVGIRWMNDI